MTESQRDVMEYEVAIVGGGPAGLACAIRLKQLKPDLERLRAGKGGELGRAFAVRAPCWSPGPLDELLPQWREHAPAICVPADARRVPVHDPSQALQAAGDAAANANHGNFIISLGQLDADSRGARPRNSASTCSRDSPPPKLCSTNPARVKGVRIGDMGRGEERRAGAEFRPGPRDPRQDHDALRGVPRQHVASSSSGASNSTPASLRRPMASGSRSSGSCRPGACSRG